MKKKLIRLKNNRVLLIILTIIVVSFTLGLLLPILLSSNDKDLLSSYLNNFFIGIKNGNVNYQYAFLSSFFINIMTVLLIWLFGISIVGFIFIVVVLLLNSFILSFSFGSILTVYGFKGFLIGIVYILPKVINLIVLVILSYYAICFSIMLYLYLFKKRNYNCINIVKKYTKVLFFSLFIMVLSSVLETFLIPFLLRNLI